MPKAAEAARLMHDAPDGPYEGLRVLDLSTGIAGAYCAKLLADQGADVVKVEPPDGDPARRSNPHQHAGGADEPGLLFWYLNANKRGVTLDLAGEQGRALLARILPDYDIVVESWAPAHARALRLTYDRLGSGLEGLIWLSMSPFGHTGPYAEYRSSELVIQAAAGWLINGGEPDREPLQTGGTIVEYITGAFGALAAAAGWAHRIATGSGQHIDLAAFEAVLSVDLYGALAHSIGRSATGRNGQVFPSAIVRCKDGHVGVNVLTPAHWRTLCAFMGRPDLLEDPLFRDAAARREHSAELTEIVAAWAGEHTCEELFRANEQGLAITLLPTVAQLLEFEQHEARGFFVDHTLGDSGVARQPRGPFSIDAAPVRLRRSAPTLGEHNEKFYRDVMRLDRDEPQAVSAPGRHLIDVETMTRGESGALSGLRVLDLSMWWAGPFCTQLLGDLGAEIIKVESVQVMDGWRSAGSDPTSERWWESSTFFAGANRNKRDVTLNLSDERGMELFRRLVPLADVIVENYTPRVMENFGLAYEQLRAIRPNIIMVSLPGYGSSGPWRDYPAYAFPVEEMAGFPQLTGYADDGEPRKWGNASADAIAGVTGAYAVLTALERRRRTGLGAHVDISQVEALTAFLGEAVLDYQVNGRLPRRFGNRHPVFAPHGLYPCAGEDRWVAIAVTGEDEWRALCACVAHPEWRTDARFATPAERYRHQDLLDAEIARWTAARERLDATRALQTAGVPAMPVLSSSELLTDEHLRARGYFRTANREEIGEHVHGLLWAHFARTPMTLRSPAPTLGQDNTAVFGDLLGLTDEELERLSREHVIGRAPVSGRRL